MSEGRIAKVPVVSEGQLVGIISVGDVIKVMYDKVATENLHLLSYIHGASSAAAFLAWTSPHASAPSLVAVRADRPGDGYPDRLSRPSFEPSRELFAASLRIPSVQSRSPGSSPRDADRVRGGIVPFHRP